MCWHKWRIHARSNGPDFLTGRFNELPPVFCLGGIVTIVSFLGLMFVDLSDPFICVVTIIATFMPFILGSVLSMLTLEGVGPFIKKDKSCLKCGKIVLAATRHKEKTAEKEAEKQRIQKEKKEAEERLIQVTDARYKNYLKMREKAKE